MRQRNAALRHQLIILRRTVRGRVRLTNSDIGSASAPLVRRRATGQLVESTAGGPTYLRISRDDQQRFGDGCRETTGALPARRLPAPGPAKTTVIPASKRYRALPRAGAAKQSSCRRHRCCDRAGRGSQQETANWDQPGVRPGNMRSFPPGLAVPPAATSCRNRDFETTSRRFRVGRCRLSEISCRCRQSSARRFAHTARANLSAARSRSSRHR